MTHSLNISVQIAPPAGRKRFCRTSTLRGGCPTAETAYDVYLADVSALDHSTVNNKHFDESQKEPKVMTAKLNYDRPACPMCGESLTPLKERVKKRCHICGWELLPVDGHDAHTADRRDYMR